MKTKPQKKRCTTCKQIKPLSEFYKNKTKSDGRDNRCKVCVKAYDRQRVLSGEHAELMRRRVARARTENANRDPYTEPGDKKCSDCQRWLPKTSFSRDRTTHDGLRNKCRDCDRVRKHARRINIYSPEGYQLNYDGRVIQDKLVEQRYRCAYCGADLQVVGYHVDHVHPLSRGGSNDPDNLVCSCATCNLIKADRLLSELGWTIIDFSQYPALPEMVEF